ncbi:MAG: hypothetical protein WAZ19_07415, partial [Anaerolineae bacterium]
MAEPLTTAAIAAKILDSLLGGAISKALDGALTTASQALRDAHQELEKEQAQRAARLALIIQQAAEEIEPELEQLQQASGQDPRSLFQHPPFLAQIARALLDNATLDVDAVRREYQTLFNDGRWDELRHPLEMFFGKIKLLLQRDAVWGPALRAYRAEAQRADIHADLGQLIAAAWAGVEALHTLPEKLAQPEQARLSAVQRAYLCGLYAECNDLPLAGDDTPDAPRGRAAPRLQRVYVDLDAKQPLTLARVLTRLQIAPADQAAVHAALAELGPQELRGQGRRQAELSEEWIGSLLQAAAFTSSDDDQKQVWQRLAQWGVTQDSLAAALHPVTAFEALRDQRHCVLLGDPGSGKSTLTRRIAGLLAAEAHDNLPTEDRDWRGALAPLFDHWCMPIRIVLSEWAQTLPAGHKGVADDLITACQQVVGQANNLGQDTLRAWLTDQLTAQSGALVLLLDGLDEVTDAAQRGTVRAAINHFCQRYPHVAVIVTCRVLPYQDPGFRLELPACTLAPLSERSVADFLQRWHAELHAAGIYGQQEAGQARQRLQEAINDPNRSDLRELAGAPLQLTLMARVNYRHGLPGSRAMLYETYVNEWLHEWERKRQADKGAATELERLLTSAGLALTDLNRVLNELAFKVHGQSGSRDTVTVGRHALQDALEGLYLSKHPQQRTDATKWAADVLHFIDKRSGLLRARQEGKLYTFAHRTFQEYLAARWIASADTATRLKAKIDDPNWAEVVLLTFGHQIFKQEQPDAALLTLQALLPDQISSEAECSRAILLGEVYVSLLEPHRVRTSAHQKAAQQVIQAMPERLQQAMQAGLLDVPDVAAPALARRRLEAGLL